MISPSGDQTGATAPETGQPACLSVPGAVYVPVKIVRIGLSEQEQKDEKGHYHSEALIRPQETDSTALFSTGPAALAGSSNPSRKLSAT